MESPGLAFKKFAKPKKNKTPKIKKTTGRRTTFLNLSTKNYEVKKQIMLSEDLKLLPDMSSEEADSLSKEALKLSDFIYLNNKLLAIVLRYLNRYDEIKTIDDLNPVNFSDELILDNYYKTINIDLSNELQETRIKYKFDFLRYLSLILEIRVIY